MRRAVMRAVAVAVGVMAVALPLRALAHDSTKALRGTCSASNTGGTARIVVAITNQSDLAAKNLTPAQLLASNTGSASIFFQSQPRPLRELLPGKTAEFIWKGRLFGDGYLLISHEFSAEFPGAGSSSSGIINCNRLAVGDVTGVEDPPTPTQNAAEPTNTPNAPDPTDTAVPPTATPGRPTRTREPTSTTRPTRTPLEPRATRTPLATNTPDVPPPTATHREPTVRPTRGRPATATSRPTRTPIVDDTPRPTPTRANVPTSTPRPTATRVVRPTRARPATATPRATRTLPPTVTSRPTRTPIVNEPTPTPRPTRTPIGPPPTATHGSGGTFDPAGLRANCSLRRTNDQVVVTMIVENNTGRGINGFAGGALQLEPEGGALFFDPTGPNPPSYGQLRNGTTASFQWGGRLTPGGTMGFSAFGAGVAEGGEQVRLSPVDCGVATAEGDYNAGQFTGTCSIRPGDPGRLSFVVSNNGGASLTDVVPRMAARNTDGSAQILNLSGPVPSVTRRLPNLAQATYEWRASILGHGRVTIQLEAFAIAANGQQVTTGRVVCETDLNVGAPLPDLTVSEPALRQSARVTTTNFPSNHCAIVEGCVGGPGTRRLLRFDTVTPNLGPGDLFIGDPSGNPQMVFSECHGHYHFEDYADYRLYDLQGNIVARGHKQAFCLIDLEPTAPGARPAQFPDCGFQGISAGWSDVYGGNLDCQWIDVTGVPQGRYVLEVTINPARVIEEGSYNNNSARTEVTIPAAP